MITPKNFGLRISLLISFLITGLICAKECPPAYSTCNLGKPGMINVHMVSHTHDDVGWLKTVDQYFYRSNEGNQDAGVQYILDTVVDELNKDKNKRFVYVEIAYFYRWWNQQTDETKAIVRNLVSEHRLEFVIGAWCMSDEATPYYTDMIDQQALGLEFILKEFDSCARPRSAWQIDPFGHSREQASLYAQFGYDGLFLGRIDYQDKDYRGQTKTREMLWQASSNLGLSAQLFTGVLENAYNPPDGFCFDQYCGDDPIMDDQRLEDYNLAQKLKDFIKATNDQAKNYKTNNLIMTMGSDFQYSNAHMWFKNLDKLIHYVNELQNNGSNINIFYSTTACYLYSLNQANTSWPIKNDDFFPYAHRPHSFWTGYFTSRAALKNYVRRSSNVLQTVRHLAAFAKLKDQTTYDLMNNLERAMGVVQHHDAVSGTEKQHVAFDYAKRLGIGVDKAIQVAGQALSTLGVLKENNVVFCSLLNISQCSVSENQQNFTVTLYNPLPRPVNFWVNLPTNDNKYKVISNDNKQQVLSEFSLVYSETKQIPERNSTANYNLVFASSLDSLGFAQYSIIKQSKSENINKEPKILTKSDINDGFYVQNKYLRLSFDNNGNLAQIDNVDTKLTTPITHNFCSYQSYRGNNSDSDFQASGAYIFRPVWNQPDCFQVSSFTVYRGKQFSEVHQIFNEYISQTIRLYVNSNNVEFEWQVGPIQDDGREIITKFKTNLNSDSTFYTDSNGREILKRVRDYRPTWKLNQTEPVSGNYYPINSRIFIKDETTHRPLRDYLKQSNSNPRQLTILTDRSQGGSSLDDGEIEIMVHRRTIDDDALGVGERLNEKGSDGKGLIIKGKFNLVFNTTSNSPMIHRDLSHQINNAPLILFSSIDNNKIEDVELLKLNAELPSNLHLLTLKHEYSSNSLIIRIEHFYELNEDSILSMPVTIDLQEVLTPLFKISSIQELALGANMPVEELDERLKWTSESQKESINTKEKSNVKHIGKVSDFVYTFNPMQIRTFRVFY